QQLSSTCTTLSRCVSGVSSRPGGPAAEPGREAEHEERVDVAVDGAEVEVDARHDAHEGSGGDLQRGGEEGVGAIELVGVAERVAHEERAIRDADAEEPSESARVR